jgi:NADPH2:quinone reductase
MAQAIVLHEPGAPAALQLEDVRMGAPGTGELRLRQTAIGVNFHDAYVRSGLYQTLPLPGIPGIEAVGVIDAVGPRVEDFCVGDRVGYIAPRYGAYATERILRADLAIKLPASVDDRTAAAALVKGLTVEMLTRKVHRVEAGDRILVHAGAGGVGQILCRKLKDIGATIIGTTGSEEKAVVARAAGCYQVILYREEDFVARVNDLTEGRGVNIVYDSVGKDTFRGSLECLAVRGHLVNFGQSSGSVPPFDVSLLAARSNTVSRPILFHYLAERSERDVMAAALFDALGRGILPIAIGGSFPLAQAGAAHEELESRRAVGSIVLLP